MIPLGVSDTKIAVIGGGAAGFFAAIACKNAHPDFKVDIYERSNKLLSKVKVSGGGRCNVTHACFNNAELARHYPRGSKHLKKAFNQFSTQDTVDWFNDKGIELKTESDNRMFPVTDDSQTIIDCLLNYSRSLGVRILKRSKVDEITLSDNGFELNIDGDVQQYNFVIVASGGSPKLEGFDWLKILGHDIVSPVPSLFTFNMPGERIISLQGVSVENAQVRVSGTKLKQSGPLLITHWGMSGPAILKTSAWGARDLNKLDYQFELQVNWLGGTNEEEFRQQLPSILSNTQKRQLKNKNPFQLPNRLWEYFLQKLELKADLVWGEMNKKQMNRLINLLLNDVYKVSGKTTFKEEFVTSGGVALADVDFNTMQSRKCPGLYFAGEVLDMDGVTGGFNFQAAWTTGFIAGQLK